MLYLVGGARPNFMKIAALSRAFDRYGIKYEIIHTGQHYDYNMNQVFFEEFGLKEPYKHLEVGSGNHGAQTGRIMERFEELCLNERPDMVVVVGDVNSSLACSLVASKLHIPVVHQEAGMRSGDKSMPEEINRILTDHVSDILFPISETDFDNLLAEGISKNVHLVGDPMIDNLLYYSNDIETDDSDKNILVEIHRPSNVDDPKKLTEIIIALSQLADRYYVIFPIHPRTRKMINEFDLWGYFGNIDYGEPMGYFDFHKWMNNSGCVITDSDGIQQETSILNVSCLAIRDTSNIPYTIRYGTTQLCNPDRDEIFNKAVTKFHSVERNTFSGMMKLLNDGHSSERIARIIYEHLNSGVSEKRYDFDETVITIAPAS